MTLGFPVSVSRKAFGSDRKVGFGWPGLIGDGGFEAMVGSLTIAYRRKRNVGGRVLRNFARSSTDTLADTFREKMLHASRRVWDCRAIGGFE